MPADSRLGTVLGGYRIESVLGRGGMGVVYLAEDLRLSRRVALKVLSPDLSAEPGIRDRFTRESRIAASLDDPNIVPIHEAGEMDGLLYIAMRYVEGTDLGKLIAEQGALDPHRTLSIVSQVASALDAAHGRGLVHRDVKPANILLVPGKGSRGEHVYLSDFGLTKRVSSDSGVTKTGQFLGTLHYAAPEQFEGRPLDARTDVYSLGCVLFECLTGHLPFKKEQDAALMYAHLQEPPPSVTAERPELPRALDSVVARAMAKKPADRFESAGDLAASSRSALQGTAGGTVPAAPQAQRRMWWIGVAATAALVVALIAVFLTRSGPGNDRPPSTPGANTVHALPSSSAVEIDPRTKQPDRIVRSLPGLGGHGSETEGHLPIRPKLVVGEGGVWALTAPFVVHIDERTGAIRSRLPITGVIGAGADIAIGSRTAFFIGADTPTKVSRINPATDQLLSPVSVAGGDATDLVVGGGALWVGSSEQTLTEFDPLTGRRERVVDLPGSPDAIAYGNGSVWVMDALANQVLRVDTRTKRVVAQIHVDGELTEIAAGDAGVWVLDRIAGTVTQIDPNGNTTGAKVRVGSDPSGIAVGLGAVWVADKGDDAVYRIDPALGQGTAIKVGSPLVAVAVDEAAGTIWVLVSGFS